MANEYFQLAAASATAGASTGAGTTTWMNPGLVAASDNSYATAVGSGLNLITQHLRASGFAFGTIPQRASLAGMIADVERSIFSGFAPTKDTVIRLDDNGALVGDNKADTVTLWPTADASATYGAIRDGWGLSGIDLSTIGLQIQCQASGSNIYARVDHVTLQPTILLPCIAHAEFKDMGKGLLRVEIPWQSNYEGVVDFDFPLCGTLERLVTVPNNDAPSNNYHVRLYDSRSLDVLETRGQSRSNSESQAVNIRESSISGKHLETKVNGSYRLNIQAAGVDKGGVVVFYYWG